ncbi:MAG: SpoIID/LytB domain-containing protein [Bacteroidaceae bacterium]
MNKEIPEVNVGIVSGQKVFFCLHGPYRVEGQVVVGDRVVSFEQGKIRWEGQTYDSLLFEPLHAQSHCELYDVVIGRDFHWQRREDQLFGGKMLFIVEGDGITAVNRVPVEDYLVSVISSEMSARASLELLKAHAVISRSWVLARLEKQEDTEPAGMVETDEERIRWYGRSEHTLYDVCADDHCQRYQGITRASTPQVARAVEETRGQVLSYAGRLCDTRFSKCCGGAMEEFPACWEDTDHPYLRRRRDSADTVLPDLTDEREAERWIRTHPDSYCHTTEAGILQQVLNRYDQETPDFYRWQVDYTREELSALVRERSGIDFGEIRALEPVQRGVSGRLVRLRIVGSRRTMTIGKELEIRRTLSPSHLYSSAFVVEETADGFRLLGAGWGHGVGLCQIGAAVMSERGFRYEAILQHYYPGSELEKRYE